MRDEVIIVEEESHGIIGVAYDCKSAIACAKDWNYGPLLTCDDRPATEEELFILSQRPIGELDDFFEGHFSFTICTLWH